jgi:serine/threonine-protein kinase
VRFSDDDYNAWGKQQTAVTAAVQPDFSANASLDGSTGAAAAPRSHHRGDTGGRSAANADDGDGKVPLEEARGQVGAYRLSAVLMDFGIVKWLEGTASMVGTLTSGGMIGTVDYVAPEQITAAHDVDSRADIYALGMMAYLMMTGRLPFKGSVGQVVYAHLQQTPPDPHLINPALPVRAADAIVRALAKVPESRFRTAGEFAAALRLGMRTA